MNECCRPLARDLGDLKQRMNVMVARRKCHRSRGNDCMRRHVQPDATWLVGAQKGSWGRPLLHHNQEK